MTTETPDLPPPLREELAKLAQSLTTLHRKVDIVAGMVKHLIDRQGGIVQARQMPGGKVIVP